MDMPLPFSRLGPYEILGCLGGGGTGRVYKAYEPSLSRHVAIKVLSQELAASPDGVFRFRAAAAAASRVVHPNVVPILGTGQDGPHHYLVMPCIEGPSLADRLDERGSLTWAETGPAAQQILAGLQTAHRLGIVHGNIKPENILLERETGRALLVDSGQGQFTRPRIQEAQSVDQSAAIPYVAPEAFSNEPADVRADLYSFGAVIYRMLTGQMPSPAAGLGADATSTRDGEAGPPVAMAPDVPRGLPRILARLLAPRPEDRYASAEAVLADLQALEPGVLRQQEGRPDGPAISFDVSDLSAGEVPRAGVPEILGIRWLWMLGNRVRGLFRAYAPEMLRDLQTTEQQVAGAIAEYQSRQSQLSQLVRQAERILQHLASRKESFRAAGMEHVEDALEASPHDLAELAVQESRMQEQLAELRMRKARVDAKLVELDQRRNLLLARLEMARARGARAGRSRASRRRTRVLVVGLALSIVTAAYPLLSPAPIHCRWRLRNASVGRCRGHG